MKARTNLGGVGYSLLAKTQRPHMGDDIWASEEARLLRESRYPIPRLTRADREELRNLREEMQNELRGPGE